MIRGGSTIAIAIGLVASWMVLEASAYSTGGLYRIGDVRIEAYYPRGLRVLLPDAKGIQLFAFHGNINTPMKDYEPGQYYKEVLRPINGFWVYEDKVARLRKGDKLYYWLYVLHDKLAYRKDSQVARIDDLIYSDMPELIEEEEPKDNYCNSSVQSESGENESRDANGGSCEKLVYNLTKKLNDAENSIASLNNTNELLKEIIENRANYKTLTMAGRISTEEEPIKVVRFVLSEKLDLRPDILSAWRNPDRSITFELGNIQDMLQLITVAKDKLAKSTSVSIIY